jgi:hypothetical protein
VIGHDQVPLPETELGKIYTITPAEKRRAQRTIIGAGIGTLRALGEVEVEIEISLFAGSMRLPRKYGKRSLSAP